MLFVSNDFISSQFSFSFGGKGTIKGNSALYDIALKGRVIWRKGKEPIEGGKGHRASQDRGQGTHGYED